MQSKLRNCWRRETWSSDGWAGEELKYEELKDEELKDEELKEEELKDEERTDEELKEEELKDEDLRVGVAIPSTRLARSKDAVTTEHSIVGLRCGRNELDGAGWNGDLGLSSQEAWPKGGADVG